MDHPGILIVDDEPQARLAIATALELAGHGTCAEAGSLAEARLAIAAREPDLVLLDLTLPDGSGETLLGELAAEHPGLPVIVITGINDVATAVRCMRSRAIDYLVKPLDPAGLDGAVRRALRTSELAQENRRLSRLVHVDAPSQPDAFVGLITADVEFSRLMLYAEIVAPGSQAVLISGETGTGKELMARALHRLSGRKGRFVAVNVAGLDDTMFADTLFGHRRGAFTGAAGDRPGLVREADGGTLFLDEIGDLAEASQVKLLRLLQEGEYYPLGADQPRRSSARILAATHRDLDAWMAEGRLRRDLYYRLHAHHLHLPPLRQRPGDIRLLLHHYVTIAARDLGLPAPPVTPAVVRVAQGNPWPGNVRELIAVIHDAVGRGRGLALDPDRFGPPPAEVEIPFVFPATLPTLDGMRDLLVAEALRRTDGDLVEASRLLGMSRWGLSKRLRSGSQTPG